ncbi:hypothetical protein DYB35_002074 [Aphanomyces astaci]|uniref:Uncharacterized protein n=1 Tax=Aphanomyces astaci TaxID=112090 RepID=A0A418D2Z5_APHAT|nr:hypothetical protein DYB35_002074 [Aphanomyces astaci]
MCGRSDTNVHALRIGVTKVAMKLLLYQSEEFFVKTDLWVNQFNVYLIDPAVTVTEIWRMLERDFGESSGLLTKFVGTLTSDYRHVGDHFKAMSALRNRINAQSVKYFGEPIVSEQLVGALFLSLLPQQYFGSSVKFTKDSFTMDKVFQLVVNTFGSKSKRDILSMSTGFGKSLNKSEFPVGQILANERKRKPDGDQNECFYCNGKYNEGANVHMKKDCPKRKEDFSKGYYCTSIFKAAKSGPAKVAAVRATRSEVAVGQVEVATPTGGDRTATDIEEAAASLDDITMQLEYAQLQGPTSSGT